jgi:signal transduction histidine kinase
VQAARENLEKIHLRRLCQKLVACLRDSSLRLVERHRALQAQNVELQEAYRRSLDAEQMRQDSVGMIVHDLRNPLSVLLISLDVLVTDFGEVLSEEQREILRSANSAGQQMLQLITNMLEVQRLEDGKMPVRLQSVDLALALRMIVRQAQPLADRKSVGLIPSVADTLPRVRADVELTSRVVANLLDNAIKFTPPNGQISVTAEPGEEEVVVCVADSGPGIAADEQANIFARFEQLERGPRQAKGSVGLGLAFCRLATEAQEGRIWVESEPGQGSQFKFALPVWRESPEPTEDGRGD